VTAPYEDPFRGLVPFVHVAQSRSFRRAAEELGVTTAAVSKAVAKLEEDLGVRLLQRTSRSVSLTPEGATYLERARAALDAVRGGRDLVAQSRRSPRGEITVSIPVILGALVVSRLPSLARRHPSLRFTLRFTDRLARLADDAIDLAVRVGPLADSSLIARKVCPTRFVTVASPAYLGRHGAPERPDALADHETLRLVAPNGKARAWVFRAPGEAAPFEVETRGALLVDHGERLLDAALAGLGVTQVLDFMARDLVRDGRLVEVLRPWATDGPAVHAVSLPQRANSANVQALVQFLREAFAGDGAVEHAAATRADPPAHLGR
jgi:LysR family transcriptional regulator for bpeEF and oprC